MRGRPPLALGRESEPAGRGAALLAPPSSTAGRVRSLSAADGTSGNRRVREGEGELSRISLSVFRSDGALLERLLFSLSLGLSRAAPGQLSLTRDVFQELFIFLSMLLDGQMSEGAGFGAPTEERTLQALHCLKSLFLSSDEKYASYTTRSSCLSD